MPEGDTVFLTARRLDAGLARHRLRRAELRHPRWVTHELTGHTVLEVRSVGKHLFLRFDAELSLHCHLRMDGRWHIYPRGQRWRRPGHQARVVLETAERAAVGFLLHDLELLSTDQEHRLVDHLGPDLLDADWTHTHHHEAVRRLTATPTRPIGSALLDQRTVAGVGNVYQSEVCFLLGISPWLPVGELPDPAEVVTLAHRLLTDNAHRPVRTTTGQLGRGRRLWVYQRAGQPCHRCGTRIRSGPQGEGDQSRTAYYCPRCQPPRGPADR